MSYYSEARKYYERNQYEEAYKLYEQGAISGDAKCYYGMALFLYKGYFIEQNKASAKELLSKNINAIQSITKVGDVEAMFILGCYHSNGLFVEPDDKTAFDWWSKAAVNGHSNSEFNVGYCYYYGRGIEKDLSLAHHWVAKSAEKGNSIAQSFLGRMCEEGIGIEKNTQKAIELYEKSEYSAAKWYLGRIYETGNGVERDFSKALSLYLESAEKGNMISQMWLGYLYDKGYGVNSNTQLAMDWYQKSANQGYPMANYLLGNIYESQLNVNQALFCWENASKGVEPEAAATYKLGYAYYDGYGVERNLKKAKEYFEKAIEQGYHCSYALNMVKGELGELDDSNKMREYADGLIKKHIHSTNLYQQISKDLQKDFGDTWNITCRETKKFLETGMFTYFSLYSLGPHIYGNMDFSASITPMFKALEKELGKYLYSGYIEFLKKKEVSPNTFPQKRSHIKRISSTELAYRDPSDLTEFTLGNLHLTVGLERKPQFAENDTFKYTIDQTMLDYLNSIFKEDAFGEAKREREITDYIISLTQEVKAISDSLRNPAAHDRAMKIHKAEVCGNYIIKVQKLLFGFLSKLK